MAETLKTNKGKKKVNNILTVLQESEIRGKNLGRVFMERKTALRERLFFTPQDHGLEHTFYVIDREGNSKMPNGKLITANQEVKLLRQVLCHGFFIIKSDEGQISLYNPYTDQQMDSPLLPSQQTVDYIGHHRDMFRVLSLGQSDDVDKRVEKAYTFTFQSDSDWKVMETTRLNIKKPNKRCLPLENHIYFLANQDKEMVDVEGDFEDLVVSFDVISHEFNMTVLPNHVVSLTHKTLVKINDALCLVAYNSLRKGSQFQIWHLEETSKTWDLMKICNLGDNFWVENEPRHNPYRVSHATCKGELVLTPKRIWKRMRPGKPVHVFIYDPKNQDEISAIDISWMKIEMNRRIFTAVDYLED